MFDTKILIDNGVNLDKSLELFGDIATYNDNLDEFLDGIEKLIVDITDYKDKNDMYNYSIVVHSLKSDAKYFGFEKLAELALDHETKSKENNVEYVNEHFNELKNEIMNVIALVEKYLGVDYEKQQNGNENNLKQSILVVDDSNIIANFVAKIFSNEYNVITAKDGQIAIDKLSSISDSIQCMLLDINMPNVDGYEVLKFMKINNLFSNINVAIISGTDSQKLIESTKEYPIKAILEKPFNEENVKRIVELIVQK